jgi:hypothetical protein
VLSIVASIAILQTPLQHEITLSRFQHYSIGVFAVALGFLLQIVVSWRHHTKWGRLAMLASVLYLGGFGLICYQNPWLDGNFDLTTKSQEEWRPRFAGIFLMAGFAVSFFWAKWLQETNREVRVHKAKEVEERVSQ